MCIVVDFLPNAKEARPWRAMPSRRKCGLRPPSHPPNSPLCGEMIRPTRFPRSAYSSAYLFIWIGREQTFLYPLYYYYNLSPVVPLN